MTHFQRSLRRRVSHHGRRLGLESLESRQMMTATMNNDTGTWAINGTSGVDAIYVARDDADPRWLIAEVNGRVQGEMLATQVSRIQVRGLASDDRIEIDETAGAIALPVVLKGDDGNDTLIAGSGPAMLAGDNGNDQLIGGAGNDLLSGGAGNDSLTGGPGIDHLDGGAGTNQFASDVADRSIVARRVPAEWERHNSTWMQWPKGEEQSYRSNFAGRIKSLQSYERSNLVIESSTAQHSADKYLRSRGVGLTNLEFHIMPND